MKVLTENFKLKTKNGPEFIDITDRVRKIIKQTGIKNGTVIVFSKHTTAAIKINENEPLLIKDMKDFLARIASPKAFYNHNDFERRTVNMCSGECANGHAHCQHLVLSTSEKIPLVKGKMAFGLWQRIFLVELDHGREREVVVQVMGE